MHIQRVLNKGGGRLFRIIPIAQRHGGPADAQFAALADRAQLILLVEDQDVGIAAWITNRERIVVTEIAVKDEARTVDVDLWAHTG